MMKSKMTITAVLLLGLLPLFSQNRGVLWNENLRKPTDTLAFERIITSLNHFLNLKDNENDKNTFVLESQKETTFILLDEMKNVERNEKLNDNFFYKPYLINIVKQNDSEYLLQIAYLGNNENTPQLKAQFNLIAHQNNDIFLFSSPFLKNIKNWKQIQMDKTQFIYENSINVKRVKQYMKLATLFDKKLKISDKETTFYCCNTAFDFLNLIGVSYKLDYNGRNEGIWSIVFTNKKLIFLANQNSQFDYFDPHDLWHDRLSLIISRSKINKPVDEGCAYLYGGSWGLSWDEIFRAFLDQVAIDSKMDWKKIKEERFNFKTKDYNNSADYIVNALLVKKIEKEKGFEGVWELLNVGPSEAGNEKYYKTLEKLTGITKENYNEKIWELINNEK
ncbi:conserved hypothetical protein [Flavobacterium sp. 9AF]|uniref:hypothetical protein n=1 Tax=Flavobacterium sp. 9AF TaxID=2653142 RepID=UPI0012F3A0B9|nr:hypothetical protein [Flavobacterium sp. 9AF]VXB55527.1 conserved hypothetical protein [Flavobacterium sp. 9AF]